jgi:RHS repeat-associated protein
MAIYHRTYQANGGTSYTDRFKQEDALIYGSARLGNWHGARLKQRGLTSATTAMTGVTYSAVPSDFWTNGQGGYPTTALSVTRELGLRQYELSNHLGNVLSTVSDRRLAVSSGSVLAYYRADEKSYADYDPYGMLLPGRFGGGFADQNFGFQGQLKDDQLHVMAGTSYAFEYRVHDSRVGRFLSVDPLAAKYSWNSPYAFAENRVIKFIELEGLETTLNHGDVQSGMATEYSSKPELSLVGGPGGSARLYSDLTTLNDIRNEELELGRRIMLGFFWAFGIVGRQSNDAWTGGQAPDDAIHPDNLISGTHEVFGTILFVDEFSNSGRAYDGPSGNTVTKDDMLPDQVLPTIDPSRVLFSQSSIAYAFKNGKSLDEVVGLLAKPGGLEFGYTFPPIRLYYDRDYLRTLDNRRLAAFSTAGRRPTYRMATFDEIYKEVTRGNKGNTNDLFNNGQFLIIRKPRL